jgi:hypothetical protein
MLPFSAFITFHITFPSFMISPTNMFQLVDIRQKEMS